MSREYQQEKPTLFSSLLISGFLHAVVLFFIIFAPNLETSEKITPEVIRVNIVSLPKPVHREIQPEPLPSKPEVKKAVNISQPKKIIPKKTVVKKKPKPAKKVDKQKINLKNTLKRLEKSVQNSPKKHKVENRPDITNIIGDIEDRDDLLFDGKAERINSYKYEVAFSIQRNWAFSEELAGANSDLETKILFKILPNGEIKDIVFTKKSGNKYLDESAYRAIVKSTPVKPHPSGASAPYITLGLNFTPKGIR